MNGFGIGIGKILVPFRNAALGILAVVLPDLPDKELSDRALDDCHWMMREYEATLKKLQQHPEIKTEEKADIYICGYYRGLRDALAVIERAERQEKSRRKNKKGRQKIVKRR